MSRRNTSSKDKLGSSTGQEKHTHQLTEIRSSVSSSHFNEERERERERGRLLHFSCITFTVGVLLGSLEMSSVEHLKGTLVFASFGWGLTEGGGESEMRSREERKERERERKDAIDLNR